MSPTNGSGVDAEQNLPGVDVNWTGVSFTDINTNYLISKAKSAGITLRSSSLNTLILQSGGSGGRNSGVGGGGSRKNVDYYSTLQEVNVNGKKPQEHKFFWRLKKQYDNGTGADFVLTKSEFDYLKKKGVIKYNEAKYANNDTYKAPINFYELGFDLKYSFGEAKIYYKIENGNIIYTGFEDLYNFDAKPWGDRSVTNEIITRGYGWWSNGKPFKIHYP
jgi:hypothetical protein